jgi:hypothetical protein
MLEFPSFGGCSSVGRVPDCDSGCRGFESHQPPQNLQQRLIRWLKKLSLLLLLLTFAAYLSNPIQKLAQATQSSSHVALTCAVEYRPAQLHRVLNTNNHRVQLKAQRLNLTMTVKSVFCDALIAMYCPTAICRFVSAVIAAVATRSRAALYLPGSRAIAIALLNASSSRGLDWVGWGGASIALTDSCVMKAS